MSRPRTPIAVLEARGSFDRHPERRRAEVETTGYLGEPPAHLEPEQSAIWIELAEIFPPGLAKNADRFAVEILCDLMQRFRQHRLKSSEVSQLLSLLGRMGLEPSSRAKLAAPVERKMEDNPFADFC